MPIASPAHAPPQAVAAGGAAPRRRGARRAAAGRGQRRSRSISRQRRDRPVPRPCQRQPSSRSAAKPRRRQTAEARERAAVLNPAPQAAGRDGRATNPQRLRQEVAALFLPRRRAPERRRQCVQSVPIAPPPPPPAPRTASTSAAAQIQLPVPVTFKALVTEARTEACKSGLTWRVYASKASPEGGGYKLAQHPPRGDADRGAAARRISRQCRLRAFQSHQEDQGGERPLARGDLRPQHRRPEARRRSSPTASSRRERRQLRHPLRRGGSVRQSPDGPAQRQARRWSSGSMPGPIASKACMATPTRPSGPT